MDVLIIKILSAMLLFLMGLRLGLISIKITPTFDEDGKQISGLSEDMAKHEERNCYYFYLSAIVLPFLLSHHL